MNTITRLTFAALVLTINLTGVHAQTSTTPADNSAQATSKTLSTPELSQLVSPIALYPDPLLANVLMASTYPLEVVMADRFMKDTKNKNLKGDALKREVEKQDWDKSVAELTATPEVLAMMSQQLSWTEKLGDAVVAQQSDVMDAVQALRARAQGENKLTTTKEQRVTTQRVDNRDYIAIEPAVEGTVYVPYYDPGVVYGAWPYADYPAYYWPPAYGWGYYGAGVLAAGIAFGAGWALGSWGNWWGGGTDWAHHDINVSRNTNIDRDRNRFTHDGNRSNRDRDRANRDRGRDNRQAGNRDGRDNRDGANRNNRGDNKQAGNRDRGGNKNAQNRNGNNKQAQTRKGSNKSAQNRQGNRQSAQNRKGNQRIASNRGGQQRAAQRARGGRSAYGGHQRSSRSFASSRGGRSFAGGRSFSGGRSFGGGRGGGGRGGGRRSDIRVKHDIAQLGYLPNGLGYYRFSYNGSDRTYVGVMAQEVQPLMPEAVQRDRNGVLRVRYDKLGIQFQTYEEWLRQGARIPAAVSVAQ